MLKKIGIMLACAMLLLPIAGCGNKDNLSPFSGRQKVQLRNDHGKIGELENLNNALKVQVEGLRSQAEVHARDIDAFQQGIGNKANSGVQVLQGDGVLIVVLVLGALAMGLAFYYRLQAAKSEKVATILAQQVGASGDTDLQERICLAALNTGAEKDIHKLLAKLPGR